MNIAHVSRLVWAITCLSSAVISLILLHGLDKELMTFPARDSLSEASGRIKIVSQSESGLYLKLEGKSSTYFYHRKSGNFAETVERISNSANAESLMLFAPSLVGQSETEGEFYPIYELRTTEGMIRGYVQVKESWDNDYRLGAAVVYLLQIVALCLSFWLGRTTGASSTRP